MIDNTKRKPGTVASVAVRHRRILDRIVVLYLPEKIKQACDFSTLKVQNSSFVESGIKQSHADILYNLKIADQAGYIYVLIEHQSTPDKRMPARMLRYQSSILANHFDSFGQFPTVVPILFYAGKQSPYPHSCNLKDYMQPA
ncbi:MAG TPA: Rpn family recombination-promoting nuclease/putative transposase [Opitutales bacterium]|nr:Rpn family recombination-promoting nuclease/putative transposase [Opitutales bacterium]